MELWDLKNFLAVASTLSFSSAAETLHLSTQAVSRSVKKLEGDLGFELLKRTTRSVSLTPAGSRFLKDASRILLELDGSIELASRIAAGESGEITVGFDLAEILGTLSLLESNLAKRHPSIELHVASYNLPHYDDLRNGKLDAYFATVYRSVPEDLNCCVLHTAALYAALPKGHALAEKEVLSFSDLHGETALLYHTEPESPMLAKLKSASLDYEIVADMGQMSSWCTLVALAGAGRGYALVSEQYRGILPHLVDYRPIDEPGAVTKTCLLWRKDDANPLVEKALVETAKSLWQ
ncbi:MAG: LysR family transcriptional regulator [Eggerthellaceae bacterium]|nr:LysR family transcriptional regulator [Eggerthellaceae bacterium]